MGRRGRSGPPTDRNLRISEASRIVISKRLEGFRASQDEVLTFVPTLANPERAVVHELCRKMGMISKSSGLPKRDLNFRIASFKDVIISTVDSHQVKHLRKDLPPVLGASVYVIACILSYDGLSGISPALESVDSLMPMGNTEGIDKSYTRRQFQYPNNPNSFLRSLMRTGMPPFSHVSTGPNSKGQQLRNLGGPMNSR